MDQLSHQNPELLDEYLRKSLLTINQRGDRVQLPEPEQDVTSLSLNQPVESELEQYHQASWMINFLSVVKRILDFIFLTKELSKCKILPLIITPIHIS